VKKVIRGMEASSRTDGRMLCVSMGGSNKQEAGKP